MLHHPNIDPVAVHVFGWPIHWYGLTYLVGFYGAYWLGVRRTRLSHVSITAEQHSDLLFYIVMGVILGGRIGYTLFYNFSGFIADPAVMFRIWQGGMSFHGGLLGVITAYFVFAWKAKVNVFDVADFAAPLIPFGLLMGRIGNFINGELWGRVTDVPWGMVFRDGGPLPRHPSMLYEAGLEGIALLIILHWIGRKAQPRMALSGWFLLLYGVFRFGVEFVRTPDAQLGFLYGTGWFTMGMQLCVPMLVIGGGLLALAYGRRLSATTATA